MKTVSKNRVLRVLSHIFLFSLAIGANGGLFAQSGLQMSVSGHVRDANTKLPMPNVEVRIFKLAQDEIIDSYTAISRKDGSYKVRFLDAGNYEFHINNSEFGNVDMILHYWGGNFE